MSISNNTPKLQSLLDKINALPDAGSGGSGNNIAPVAEKDVNFYDYDGTCLYAYTIVEAQSLTELPPLPSHDGLICQGWNWTLADINALNRPMNIGAMYITDDGKTRLYLHIATDGRMDFPLNFAQTVSNGVEIDWGDGSAIETLAGTGVLSTVHHYNAIGDYLLTLNPTSGCTLTLGKQSVNYSIVGSYAVADGNIVYGNMVQKVEIGRNVTILHVSSFRYVGLKTITIPNTVTRIRDYCFHTCRSLQAIVIPNSVTTMDSTPFSTCVSLKMISIPNEVSAIPSSMVNNCYSLHRITIPDDSLMQSGTVFDGCYSLASIKLPYVLTAINSYTFRYCYALSSVVIPSGVTNIGANAFYQCYGLAYIDFTQHTAVPTLANTNALTGIRADCEIRVPAALYDEWVAATNWATYAANIVGV